MKPQNIMLDIETLGTGPGCIILSIAAVRFDPFAATAHSKADEFYMNVNVVEQLLFSDAYISEETRKWWHTKSEQARAAVCQENVMGSVADILHDLHLFMMNGTKVISGDVGLPLVWARSPAFDCTILEHVAKERSQPVAWNFRTTRDVRTIVGLAEGRTLTPIAPVAPTARVHHNALHDCYTQIENVQQAVRTLSNGTR